MVPVADQVGELHYGYALVMLIFLWVLRKGFTGLSRKWWTVALDPVLAPHRTLLLIARRPFTTTLGKAGAMQRSAIGLSPGRIAFVLQLDRIHSHGDCDVLPHVSAHA